MSTAMSHSDGSHSAQEKDFGPDSEVQAFHPDNEPHDDFNLARLESRGGDSIISRRLTGAQELIDEAHKTDAPLPPMGGGKDYPPPLPDREAYLVSYNGEDDPTFPHNWSLTKRVWLTFVSGYTALSLILGSSMLAETNPYIMAEFHIGNTTATLTTSLFVFGFASGPVIWGPISELYGRRLPLVLSSLGYVCFCFGVATAKDIQTIMICRFFAGFVGAAPLVVSPAIMADLWNNHTRGKAVSIFAMVLFGGPMLAPIIGGFTVKNPDLGWRWTGYIVAIIASSALVLSVFCFEETHHQLLLTYKAEELRRRTGNWGIGAAHEEVHLSLKEVVEKNLTRPVVMLVTEPILLLVTIYNAFIYGLLYLLLTAIPLIFIGEYHFSLGVGELPYLSMFIGILLGGVVCAMFETRYNRKMAENNGKPVPEERLVPMMLGSFVFTAGLFWLGWAGGYASKVHWIVPTLGAAPLGFGLITIFLPCLNYIIDCYLFYAASAVAGNTLLRSAFGAAFPLFARPMFEKLTIKWAATLLGCVALVMIPVPFLFYKYGKRLRSGSKYAFDL